MCSGKWIENELGVDSNSLRNRICNFRKCLEKRQLKLPTEEKPVFITEIRLLGVSVTCTDGTTRHDLVLANIILKVYGGEIISCKIGKKDNIGIVTDKGIDTDTVKALGNLLGYMSVK